MRIRYICKYFLVLVAILLSYAASAERVEFTIEEGTVVVTPAFCPPSRCEAVTGVVRGEFTADIDGDDILILDASIKSEVTGFTLPDDPNLDSGGTTRWAEFSFDSQTLHLEGVVDSRAFDGPLYEYYLVAERVSDVGKAPFDKDGFYLARQDFRKCLSPMCGGLYVSAANSLFLQCPDGGYSMECYVGNVDWSKLGGNVFEGGETLLLKGVLNSQGGEGFGRFRVEDAYRPVSEQEPRGLFFGVQNNGLVCITTPCFSFDQYLLNRTYETTLSKVNLEQVGAAQKEIERAFNLMAEGKALLAVGYNRPMPAFAGLGKELHATQFYLPVMAEAVDPPCPPGYAETGMGCATRNGCFYPDLEQITRGGIAMADPVTGELVGSGSYSCVRECMSPAEPFGEGYCLLSAP